VKTRSNLTKSEKRTDSANAERLKFAGLAIGVENAASSEAPLLRIDQSEYSDIYAGTRAGMALAICLRVEALTSGITLRDDLAEITIRGCEDAEIFLVSPPPEKSLGYRVLGWLDLPQCSVLNHRIFRGRPLPRGVIFDGILVAQSFARLPSQFQTGMLISAKIRFADQGNVFTSEVRLSVARCEQSLERREKRPNLFGTGYRDSSPAQDQDLTGENSKPMSGIASVNKKEPVRRSHV
jgi:hypothetical protein